MLAVKPQDIDALLAELAPAVPAGHLVVSVAAGIPTAFIERGCRTASPVVRCMPNTPALVDEAMTRDLGRRARRRASTWRVTEALLRPVGKVMRVPESQLDAVTALSGSGPGVLLLPRRGDDRRRHPARPAARGRADLIVQTALGSAVMLRDSGEHPVQLREAVTSPGGTTIAAIRELERHGVRAALLAAIEAARDRAREIAAAAE